MTSLLITNCRRFDADEEAPLCSILVRDGRIERIDPTDVAPRAERQLDAEGRLLVPGLIDVHIQGAAGADVLDATPQALETISRACARHGVTGFLATTVYKPEQDNTHLTIAADCMGHDLGGAELLGTHLEGPFIASAKRGMIQPDCLGQPTAALLDRIYDCTGDSLRMMTMAPELPGSLDLVRPLVANGVIAALGHTAATYEEALRGFDAGIHHVTHLFNAMPGMHHRAPGPLAAVFERADVTAQVIVDGVHIHPSMVRLAYGQLGADRFVTITDGIQAMGLPDGQYVYNGLDYEAKEGTARYHDGTLIGTALGLNQMTARLMKYTGCSLTTAIQAATKNPARLLGLDARKGALAPGYDADLVLFDDDLSVYATLVAGRIVYQAS